MDVNKGLWTQMTIEGFSGALGSDFNGKTHLLIRGPERRKKGSFLRLYIYSRRNKKTSEEVNMSKFENLLAFLQKLVDEGFLQDPFGNDHSAVFRRFNYYLKESPERLLEELTGAGFSVKITEIDHNGSQIQVDITVKAFKEWINSETVFKPNPIEAERKLEEKWRAQLQKSEMIYKILLRFVIYPLFFFTIVTIVIIWKVMSPVNQLLGVLSIVIYLFFIVIFWRDFWK